MPKEQGSLKKIELVGDEYIRVKRFKNQKNKSLEQRILTGEFG